MKNDYTITNDWDEDLKQLLEDEPSLYKINHWAVGVIIAYSEKPKSNKGKAVIANIERIPDLYRALTFADYIIVIHKPSLVGLSKDQVRIAMFEQLLKIKIEETTDGTDIKDLLLKGYDYEGFKEIIDKYGVDWDKPWSRQMTLEDLQRDEEDAEA